MAWLIAIPSKAEKDLGNMQRAYMKTECFTMIHIDSVNRTNNAILKKCA